MIKLRMDVDYPYPSRLQSFLFTILNRKIRSNYLKNSKIIAKMVNESPREVKAYWFFTPQTTPDEEMLKLMRPDKHEVALHVANNPYKEMARLEKTTGRKLNYYTVHGTDRLFARLMWRRRISEAKVPIPEGFPLKDFWDFLTLQLDYICARLPTAQAMKTAEEGIANGKVLHAHPEWLFQRGKLNHRGPYYETLRTILDVDAELQGLRLRRKGFARIVEYVDIKEYERDILPTKELLEKLTDRGADIFTFVERKWCSTIPNPSESWLKAEEYIALLHVTSFSDWWNGIGKKTRNMVRKAEKSGVTTAVVKPTAEIAEGVWKIYNDTPIRQGRAFSRYGISLQDVTSGILSAPDYTYILAYFQNEIVGFIQLVKGDKIAIISQILSLQSFWNKAVNNALVAKAIEVCAAEQIQWFMYGRMGNHPSLDSFKQSNGFAKFTLTRYYVPLTKKGRIATKLNLHRELKDRLPQRMKGPLFPVFSWVSRTKMRIRLKLRSR